MYSCLVILRTLAILSAINTHPADTVTAFVDVSVIPMDHERVLEHQTVLVQGQRIAAFGPVTQMRVPTEAVRIDGRGKYLIPGLADMHVHPLLDDSEDVLTDESLKKAERQFFDLVANGVTTIRIMMGAPKQLALRALVREGKLLGPTMYVASPQLTSLNSPKEAVELVTEYRAAGYDFIKVRNPEITLEVFDSFVAAARRMKLPFGGHVPTGDVTLERWLEAHPVSIEHLDGYWSVWRKPYNGRQPLKQIVEEIENGTVRLDDSALAAAAAATKRAGVWNVPTSAVYSGVARSDLGMSPEQAQAFMELRGRIIKTLHDAGVGFLVGSDAPGANTPFGLSVHTELQLLVTAGFTPYQALEAGTRNAATFLGTLDRTGTIEANKRADLVLLNGNPLENIRNTLQLAGVMIGGQWIPRTEIEARRAQLTDNP